MADLQRRLAALGYSSGADEIGTFGPATSVAVSAFQDQRGLRIDGICGEQTWAAVVEAGFRLGDRRLYQRKPMMRGDDVADLQRRLGALGFDAGKVDGIFGPDTASALEEFQRNAGITPDTIFGPDELQVLARIGNRGEGLVAELRELAALRGQARSFTNLRIVVGHRGGLDGLATSLTRMLRRQGADAVTIAHPDGSELAQQANAATASLFMELASLGAQPGCRTSYYRGYNTMSPAGRALAEQVQAHLPAALGVPGLGACGMAVPVLRETRMPAILLELGPTTMLVEHGPNVIAALAQAIDAWVAPHVP